MKNEQLEILYSNLRQNPVWQDCMNTVNKVDNNTNIQNLNDDDKKRLSRLIKRSKDDTSTSMIVITRPRGNSRSAARSRSLSPSGRITRDSVDNNDNRSSIDDYDKSRQDSNYNNRHKLVLSNDMLRFALIIIVFHIILIHIEYLVLALSTKTPIVI